MTCAGDGSTMPGGLGVFLCLPSQVSVPAPINGRALAAKPFLNLFLPFSPIHP
jgi:hypothetical protein